MKMFLIGFFTCYCAASLLIFLADEYDLDFAAMAFIQPWCALIIVVLMLPFIVWRLLRHVVNPVEPENVYALRKLGMSDRHLFGQLYFCYDRDAKKWYNRAFFFRIRKETQR